MIETIYGIGIDLVHIARIEQMIQRWGNRFLQRTFTPQEIAYCSAKTSPAQHYSGRFAAKEAVFKALGTGWSQGIGWHDIEVCTDARTGQPSVRLSEKCLAVLGHPAAYRVLLTISHDKEYAIAQAVLVLRG